jgi:hypothetical protein
VTRTLTRVEEVNRHGVDNDSDNPVVGVYRWVDKIQRYQIFRYPNRFLIEFQIPEPGAFRRWLSSQAHGGHPAPEFTLDGTSGSAAITPTAITRDNYTGLAALFRVAGLDPPPPAALTVAAGIKLPSTVNPADDKQPIDFEVVETLAIANGYHADTWRATVQSWHNHLFANAGASVRIAVGAGPQRSVATAAAGGSIDAQIPDGRVGPISVGKIPVSIMSDAVYGYAVNVEVDCQLLPATLQRWQLSVFERLQAAHQSALDAQREAEQARAIGAGIVVEGDSPARNSEIVREELKRLAIEMLIGADFRGRPATTRPANAPREVDLAEAARRTAEVQFFEQAFEWEKLSYVLYGYYWAGAADWPELARLTGNDEEYARFLRSGSARVVLPVRPGLERDAQLYLWYGLLWGGGPAPAPGDPEYISVAQEIMAQTEAPDDGIPGDSWEHRLPTSLVWLENDVPLPGNPNPQLAAPAP